MSLSTLCRVILTRIALGCALLSAPIAAPALAQDELTDGPKTVIINYSADAAKRADFRQYMAGPFAARLSALRGQGKLAAFQV